MVIDLILSIDGSVLVNCDGVDDYNELISVSVIRSTTLLFKVCTMINKFNLISVVLPF